MTGRTQYFDQADRYGSATTLGAARDKDARWSFRRMLLASAVLSVGLWAPIIYLTVKVFGH